MKCWLLAPGFCLLAAAPVWSDSPPTKKVLIIGIDGTMPAALAVADTPNIDALKAEGAFSDRAITHPVTHSAACWSSMFTGVWGDKHGVNAINNSFAGNQFATYPNFMKRLETADSSLNTVAYLRWGPLSTALAGTDEIQSYGSDGAIVSATVNKLATADPDVFYTILLDVDSVGHSSGWGPAVPAYVQAIETADGRVGQILAALTSRATYAQEDWLVIVLSDHGKHDDVLELSRITFHLAWGPSVPHATIHPSPGIVDVCATVLTHMGVAIEPGWDLDARVEGLARPPAGYGENLIFNGDAEFNSGTGGYTLNRGIAWWFDPDSISLGIYGSHPDFPAPGDGGPAERGANFFLGGTAPAAVTQMIPVAHLAADIDGAGVSCQLSGWLGGAGSEEDTATLSASFLDEGKSVLGSVSIGPVTAGDRGGATSLLDRTAAGTLPAGTRLVEFSLSMQSASGVNNASADNLSFVLVQPELPPVVITGITPLAGGWQVEIQSHDTLLYELHRSLDLQTWIPVDGPTPGHGGPLLLADPAPPPGSAFYQVSASAP